MIVFWLILILMLLLAVWFVAAPLIGKAELGNADQNKQNILIVKDQLETIKKERDDGELTESEYQQQYTELQKALVGSVIDSDEFTSVEKAQTNIYKWTLISVLVITPVIAVPVYMSLGSLEFVEGYSATQQTGHSQGVPVNMDDAITNLALRLKNNPDDIKGWYMLARSYMSLRRFNEAAEVYAKLYRLVGDEPSVLLAYADSLAMSRNGRISGLPFQLVLTALEKEPDNKTALWLAGLGNAEKENFKEAIVIWEKLLPLFNGDDKTQDKISQLIANANARLAGSTVVQATTPSVVKTDTASPYLTVSVSLSDEFKNNVKPSDVVFIYAKAMQGPPMPLAAVRKRVSDLPITVRLDDSMAMMPQMKLSSFPMVSVGARISKTGSAIGQTGDLQGIVGSVVVNGSKMIEIEINTVK